MSNYHYLATIGFECGNAYKLINRAMNINLKTNYDEYECEDYQISLDSDMAFVYFKEPNKALIRRTMDTIAYALGEDQYCWDLRNQKTDREVPEIKIEGEEEESERPRRNIPIVDYTGMDSVEPEDEFDGITDIWFDHSIDYDPDYVPEEDDELDGEMSVIPHDDCSSCCSANDCTEEEALEILAEYAEEERIEAEKQKKYDDLYKEKYNKMIADGWFADQAEFLATIHKFLAIIEDTPRAHMKIIHVRSMYVYIERNVKVMIVYIFEERKKSINRMLNQMSTKIVELKEQTIEHMAKGNIRASAMENLFSVMNSADQKIKETLNIINEVEVQE